MNLRNDQKNKSKWKIVISFWSAVIFSFGFYLIYFFQAKKYILKVKKNIEIKLMHLRNICIALYEEILNNYQHLVFDETTYKNLFDKNQNIDYSLLLNNVVNFIANHPQLLNNNTIESLLIRLSIIQKNANYIIQNFNIYSYHFPYNYLFIKLNFHELTIIKPILSTQMMKPRHL